MRLFLCLFALLWPVAALPWGFAGHRRLTAHLHDPLPAGSCLKQWLAASQNYAFQDKSCDPDRWRYSNSASYDVDEWPRHFLEIDRASPLTLYPRDWAAVQAMFGQHAAGNGTVPFRVEEYYGKLVANFRAKNAAASLTTIAHLAHYVTDAFSPLHDTRFFDPHLSAEDTVGLHARYESDMLEVRANLDGITGKMATYLGTMGRADPRNNIFDAVLTGNPVAQQLIQTDFEVNGDLPKLYTATSDATARRWGDALTVLASVIATAWVDAGSPTFTGMSAGCTQAVPQGALVLKGYPFPEPLPPAEPDAGTPVEEATVPDAGTLAPKGEEIAVTDPGTGCAGCAGGTSTALVFPLGLVLAGFSRRRRS